MWIAERLRSQAVHYIGQKNERSQRRQPLGECRFSPMYQPREGVARVKQPHLSATPNRRPPQIRLT
ncbi:MAG: hypothetical protein FWB91_09725 [Defluviitaleaceae bacterium]|nr:hypothetical protein [Defluviitaleaceae bacterium]